MRMGAVILGLAAAVWLSAWPVHAQSRRAGTGATSHATPAARSTSASTPRATPPTASIGPRQPVTVLPSPPRVSDAPAFRPHYRFRPRTYVGGSVWAGYPLAYPYDAGSSAAGDQGADDSSIPVLTAADTPLSSAPPSLDLDVQPSSAQVFVDGLYVGTVADFNAFGGMLSPGAHRIDLRADGYEAITLPVAVVDGRTVSYRESMTLRPGEAPARSAAQMYSIPGCYLGNVPPVSDSLPVGCNAGDVRLLDLGQR